MEAAEAVEPRASFRGDVDRLWIGLAESGQYLLQDRDVPGLALQWPPLLVGARAKELPVSDKDQ